MESVEKGLQAVAFGQADVFLENLAVASFFIGKLGIINLKVAGTTEYKSIFRIGVSRKYPVLYNIIQKTLSDIDDESLGNIHAKWIKLKPHNLAPVTIRLFLSGFILFLVFISFLSLLLFWLKKIYRSKI